MAMDFVGPLPMDNNYDCILTMTDRISTDIRIIPTCTDITAEDLAILFFDNWYCENSLPNNIVCDHDKLFVTKLTGVKLKMSTPYHPETNGASEHSNKTVNQMLRFHVKCNQKGWVWALPQIYFQIMNTVNSSTKFTGFQLHLGRSPHIIPPLVPNCLPMDLLDAAQTVMVTINRITNDVAEVQDNLLLTKITQTFHADTSCVPEPNYKMGDLVMLSM